jgi:hypothetical protein
VELPSGSALLESPVTVRPSSHWKVTKYAEERLSESPIETLWQRVLALVLVLVGAAYVIVFGFRSMQVEGSIFIFVKSFALIGLGFLILNFLYRRLSNFVYIGPGLKRLMTKIPDEAALPVRIQILQKGSITGVDEGYIWFNEGTLYYKGLQTVFRIDGTDLVPLNLWPRADRPNPGASKFPNVINLDTGKNDALKVKIVLIDPFEDFQTRRKAHEFDLALTRWINERPTGPMETLLPPSTVHPALMKQGFGKTESLIVSGALVALCTALLVLTPFSQLSSTNGSFATLFTVGASLFFLFRSFVLARDLYRDMTVREEMTGS